MSKIIQIGLDRSQLDLLAEMYGIAEGTLNIAPMLANMLQLKPSTDYLKAKSDFNKLMQDITLQARAHVQLTVDMAEVIQHKKTLREALNLAFHAASNQGKFSLAEDIRNLQKILRTSPQETIESETH